MVYIKIDFKKTPPIYNTISIVDIKLMPGPLCIIHLVGLLMSTSVVVRLGTLPLLTWQNGGAVGDLVSGYNCWGKSHFHLEI
jgi:hypothetical protein